MIGDIRFEPAKKERLVLHNCIKMLYNRKKNFDFKTVSELAKTDYDDLTHSCTVNINDTLVKIKIVNEKISTLGKSSGLLNFLENNQEHHKIIICEDIILRPFKEIIEYPQTEIFWIKEFIINPVEHYLTPLHIPLSQEEKENFLKEYNIKLKDLPTVLKIDTIVRYYNLKVDDVVKIVRPSISSGESVFYRKVTNCLWDKLFQ